MALKIKKQDCFWVSNSTNNCLSGCQSSKFFCRKKIYISTTNNNHNNRSKQFVRYIRLEVSNHLLTCRQSAAGVRELSHSSFPVGPLVRQHRHFTTTWHKRFVSSCLKIQCDACWMTFQWERERQSRLSHLLSFHTVTPFESQIFQGTNVDERKTLDNVSIPSEDETMREALSTSIWHVRFGIYVHTDDKKKERRIENQKRSPRKKKLYVHRHKLLVDGDQSLCDLNIEKKNLKGKINFCNVFDSRSPEMAQVD